MYTSRWVMHVNKLKYAHVDPYLISYLVTYCTFTDMKIMIKIYKNK